MATVWMRSKLMKMKRDAAKARAVRPFDYEPKPTTPPLHGVKVTLIETGPKAEPEGKLHRRYDNRTHGNFKRRGAVVDASVYAPVGQVLLRGGRVVP